MLDTDWNPFNDDIIASGSDDGKVFLWQVPDNFTLHTDADEPADVKPVGKLTGHSRKVGHVFFNPAAENVLASASGDFTVKLWDLEDGKSKLTLKHNDTIQSLAWSANGSMLVTTSRDKKLRFWDVRQEKPAHEVASHTGAKNSRVTWLGDHDRVVTTGFSRMSERQLGLWDLRDPSKPIGGNFEILDSSSGVGMPFWDDGTQMLYIAGKGDGNIRYSEYTNDKFEPLSEYKSGDPQRGLAFMPKRGVNTHENEVMRAYKTVNDAWIEPISFIVPRRSETFQDDIYPATVGLKPAMSSGEWLEGKTALPPKISMEDLYEGQEPKEVAAEDVPKPTPARTAAAPAPSPAVTSRQEIKTGVSDEKPAQQSPREMPKLEDNKQSMSNMASKFADKDAEESSEDETSSFEEVQKPVERPAAAQAARQEVKTGVSDEKTTEASRTSAPAVPELVSKGLAAAGAMFSSDSSKQESREESKRVDEKPSEATTAPSTSPQSQPSASSAAGGLKDVLSEIRGLLQKQSTQIEQLTSEVAQLKAKAGV